jgi:ubiquinone/menaquinone biosynthesis C-methylase UbiE
MESQQAKHENTVKTLYQDENVAEKYIDNRFIWSWSRLLHESQVSLLNQVIKERGIHSALELAPGPARLTTEVKGIDNGLMVEASEEMVNVAKRRLKENNLQDIWEIKVGNAFDLSDIKQKFNLVYTFRFIRHFDDVERGRLYAEISSCLEQGGILVFDVVNKATRNRIDGIESKNHTENPEKLPVYDITYNADEFRKEMETFGFEVLQLIPTIKHYFAQTWISHKFDRRIPLLSNTVVQFMENLPTSAPLEWVAVCRKI